MSPLFADPETVQMRRSTCDGCVNLRDTKLGPRCADCKCFLELKTKLAGASCPIGLW